jgi:hypothetical protein
MCFSANASFAGAAVVAGAGVVCLSMVRERREIPFAALPLLFGVHQFLEGVTWTELDGRSDAVLNGWGTEAWVMFAWALLPAYVPWATWLLEDDPKRKRLMTPLLVLGILLGLFMITQAVQPEIQVSVVNGNLDYVLGLPFPGWVLGLPYVLTTCLTPSLSTRRWVRVFGIGNFLAMTLAGVIEYKDYSSIWCTLAAFLSLIIVVHFVSHRRLRRGGVPDIDPAGGVNPALS